jgi:hypothetical protein
MPLKSLLLPLDWPLMTPDEEQRLRDLPALIVSEKDREKANQLSIELLRLLKEAEEIAARRPMYFRVRQR